MYLSVALLSCLSVLGSYEAARILVVVPTPSISHQVVFRPLTEELAKRGHEVTVITTDPAFPKGKAPPNLIEVDLHDLSYKIWREEFVQKATGNRDAHVEQFKVMFHLVNVIFDKQLQTKEFQEILKKGEDYYDLLMLETWFRPTLVMSHVFKAPVIQISSFSAMLENYEVVGVPSHPLLYPTLTQERLYNLTMWEKVRELYTHFTNVVNYHNEELLEDEMLRRHFGPDVPPLSKLKDNVGMLFLNMHPILEGNFPVPPSVVHLWGIYSKPEKELPKDLKDYLDSSKHGVIYMSFGTNVDPTLLTPEKIQTFVKVFSKLPYDVLWKWNGDELPGRTDNIKISKWFPQSDLLNDVIENSPVHEKRKTFGHPKVILFVTQGGLQSTEEAITAGVPLVGIPMLGDQWFNTDKYVHFGIGKKLDMETISEDIFKEAVTTVIGDKSYRENIVHLNTLMRDQPDHPLTRAVWWTEHVLRHGSAAHLRAPAANMSWAQYYEIELVLIVLAVFTSVLAVFVFIVYKLYKLVTKAAPVHVKSKVKKTQ